MAHHSPKHLRLLAIIGPGILVAATGVGAGDLATAAFTGSTLGLAVLWAVLLGAFLKYVLNEGLARWQLATGTTLLEGCVAHFGRVVSWLFLAYLLVWSFFVAGALMSAVGVAGHAIWPLFGAEAAEANKIFYGLVHSLLAVALIRAGGYPLFEKVMSVCIGVMFAIVVLTAVAMRPAAADFLQGLVLPTIPTGGVAWTVALMGGVGGTLTVLCYGYWIREVGREEPADLRVCRIDLAVGYTAVAIFGLSMVVIGSSIGPVAGGGVTLLADIAERLELTLGRAGHVAKWAFLVGAWATVFSSLLGVWQSVPYLFADLWMMLRTGEARPTRVDTRALPYQIYLFAIATIPMVGLVAVKFRTMQQTYAITGALFIPMLAAALLVLNGRAGWVGERFRNSWATTAVLAGALLFFIVVAGQEVYEQLFDDGVPGPAVHEPQ